MRNGMLKRVRRVFFTGLGLGLLFTTDAGSAPLAAQGPTPGDTASAVFAAAAPGTLVADPAAGPLRLEVSLGDRVIRVLQRDSVLRSYPVAIGKPEHPTPRGQFAIRRVIWNPGWIPPAVAWARGKRARQPGDPENPMGRVKLFFSEPDYYIHGTNREESLGRAESHGCVRMANEDIVELARVVMQHGGEPRPADWFSRVVEYVRATREVKLSLPVDVTVTE